MGTDALPTPPVPAEADLKDFPFAPLYRARLFGSAFHARASDAEWRAGVTLWLKAQDQRPAGSLPDDDVELCRLAELGRDLRTWRKLRAGALHGWYKCADGRLYHAVVAEVVNDQWQSKLNQRQRTLKARIAALEKRLSQIADATAKGDAEAQLQALRQSLSQDGRASVTEPATEPVTGPVTDPVTGAKGQGQGQGKRVRTHAPSSQAPSSQPPSSHFERPAGTGDPEAALHRIRTQVWRCQGRPPDWIARRSAGGEGRCQAAAWLALLPEDDILAAIATAYRAAADRGEAIRQPWTYLTRVIEGTAQRRPARPGERPAVLHPDYLASSWRQRMGSLSRGFWMDGPWGPKPGQPGCAVPADILAEFGYGW